MDSPATLRPRMGGTMARRRLLTDEHWVGLLALPTSGRTGSELGRGRNTSSVSARRLKVVWSGTARSRPSRVWTHKVV
jgi:hypothetical protein